MRQSYHNRNLFRTFSSFFSDLLSQSSHESDMHRQSNRARGDRARARFHEKLGTSNLPHHLRCCHDWPRREHVHEHGGRFNLFVIHCINLFDAETVTYPVSRKQTLVRVRFIFTSSQPFVQKDHCFEPWKPLQLPLAMRGESIFLNCSTQSNNVA
jgi:hypothetical protein